MTRFLAAITITISILFLSFGSSHSEDETASKVQLSDILQGRVQVVGLLGQPIGEIFRLRGSWRKRPFGKGSNAEFVIGNVNEKQLATPIVMDSHFVQGNDHQGLGKDFVLGDNWEMIAYEGIQVSRQEAMNKALGKPLNQNPFDGLRSFISGVVVRVSKSTQ